MTDLAFILAKLALSDTGMPRLLATVGPRALSLVAYIDTLREGMRAPPGMVLDIPRRPARMLARCAEWIPSSALTTEALIMLEESAAGGNTADAGAATEILGKPLRDPAHFAGPTQQARAVCAWAAPACRIVMALLWLWTAWVSWFAWPHEESRQWLLQCGLPSAWAEPALLAASLLDACIGAALLAFPRRWLWPVQIALIAGYTVIMSWHLPQFWLHPFGPLSKNLPILAILFAMWRLAGNPQEQHRKGK